MKHHPVAQAMAAVMAERAATGGGCTQADLQARGFTRAEIETHADAARAIARALTTRRLTTRALHTRRSA